MKKVYQTIVDNVHGNCMQAAVASLFEEELKNVPNFVEFSNDEWWNEFVKYFESKGYKEIIPLYNPIIWPNILPEYSLDRLKEYNGINGYFFGKVCSPKYNPEGILSGAWHAVVVDKNFNIVHDVNPNNINIKYPLHEEKYNGIRSIEVFEKIKK